MSQDAVSDPSTGVSFPLQRQFWVGGPLRCLGAGARVHKLGFISVKVYSVAMYADAGAAAAAASGESQPVSEAAAQHVLCNGAFDKALQMHMVRGITGKQFTDALDERLKPIMTGDEPVLHQFSSFFHGKQLDKGTEITLLWTKAGPTEVCVRDPADTVAYTSAQPELKIGSPRLGHALWELYLSDKPPSPDARKAWLAAVPALSAAATET